MLRLITSYFYSSIGYLVGITLGLDSVERVSQELPAPGRSRILPKHRSVGTSASTPCPRSLVLVAVATLANRIHLTYCTYRAYSLAGALPANIYHYFFFSLGTIITWNGFPLSPTFPRAGRRSWRLMPADHRFA